MSFFEIIQHLRYYNLPLLQRQIVRIILMVPIYALGSALSLTHPDYAIYVNTIRDVYEAFVIHCFLQVMLDYPGGEAKVVEGILERCALPTRLPTPLGYSLAPRAAARPLLPADAAPAGRSSRTPCRSAGFPRWP